MEITASHILLLVFGFCVNVFAVAATTDAAWADSIDGEWCSPDGSRLVIDGNYVTTPGGSKIKGAYDRHHFTFTMPQDDTNGGLDVDMVLTTDSQISVRYLAYSTKEKYLLPEFWVRCRQSLS
jgi:hypothetical protein